MKLLRQPVLWLSLIATVLLLSQSIQVAGASKSTVGQIAKGQTLYTQFSLFYEKNTHLTTNYRRGTLVPINTAVKWVKPRKNSIVVTLPNGENLEILNVKDYSGEKIDGIFTRTLAFTPVDLSSFTMEERAAILDGNVLPGMTKQGTILALGYPPRHRTPSLESDQWQYWKSRFDTFIVHFEGGKIDSIQD